MRLKLIHRKYNLLIRYDFNRYAEKPIELAKTSTERPKSESSTTKESGISVASERHREKSTDEMQFEKNACEQNKENRSFDRWAAYKPM